MARSLLSRASTTSNGEPDPAALPLGEVTSGLGIAMRAAAAYVEFLRRRHPGAVPAQVLHLMDQQFLMALGLGGSGTGLFALRARRTFAVAGLSAAHLGGAGILSAFYLLARAHLYGLGAVESYALLRSCTLGSSRGGVIQEQFDRSWWRTALAYLPASQVRFAHGIAARSLRRAARKGGVSPTAAALPPGIGAGLGFAGGRVLGNRVIDTAAEHLGAAPNAFLGSA